MTFSIFLTISKYLILLMEEILHQLLGSLSHHLPDFIHSRWLAGFLPSTVCHKRLLNTKLLKERLDAQSSGHSPCSQESKLTAFAMALDKSGPTCSASRRHHSCFIMTCFNLYTFEVPSRHFCKAIEALLKDYHCIYIYM